ncbi:DMT family transporter [Limimaricola pyoseonensis]|uniref:Permease of the drug/metabolite transporter (DMT) superfamily n=1 Tax=Limimaricola pyoseonensis TaxID=521013 RepID=A0A1G7AFA6_9RHOB|nr:DMT family transporter [Limimaricola pyoseonensis]SDE13472.1 Permease of the drug/metabolite transporter (DMT) superfamily [Limimaricola pyoseonensis]
MTDQPPHRPLAGALWMLGAVASFSAMAIAGREVGAALDTFEIMFWRSLVGLALIAAFAGASGRWRTVGLQRPHLHLMRNIAHFTGQNLWFWAITAIPLAQVFALEFSSPLWVILIAPLALGEPLTRRRLGAVSLGFLGILLVARPDAGAIEPGILAALAAAVCFATTAVFTKRLTRHESVVSVLVWLTALQTVFGFACAGFDGDIAAPGVHWPGVALIGFCGLAAHGCLTRALSLAPAGAVMPVDFLRLPVIAALGWLLYAEPLAAATLAGGALILVANWINLRRARPRRVPVL